MQENTFTAHMQRTYSHNELADMANHGANTGHHGLIWTRDLVTLYDEHGAALHALLAEYKDETGELPQYVLDNMDDVDTFKGSVVYFAAEWVASNITQGEYIDENTPEVAEYIGE